MEIDEMKGQSWAVNFLVPLNEYIEALQTLDNPSDKDLAQHFRVTIDFILLRRQLK